MRQRQFSRKPKIGAPPGSMIFVGEQKADQVTLQSITYNADRIAVKGLSSPDDLPMPLPDDEITWINVNGLHDPSVLAALGSRFGIHPLVLEDAVNTCQRPKIEIHDDYIFVVLRTFNFLADGAPQHLESSQFSLIFGQNYLLTCQEKAGELLTPILERLQQSKGKIRQQGSDYLAYTVLDIIVDYYFPVLENLDELIAELEEQAASPDPDHISTRIHLLKRDLLQMRKAVWPLRELTNLLQLDLVRPATAPYFRDLHDHLIQILDLIDTYRDMLESIHDIYFSAVSLRMNDIMKTLAIISTIFIPLTFLAGVYGMNFEHMPELKTAWGYPVLWGVFAVITLLMIGYFHRKKWL